MSVMKRKYLAIIYLLLLSIGTILSLYIPKNEAIANDAVVIPSDAIRLRILANSDSAEDQALKRLVRDAVNEEISKWVADLTSKEEARKVIQAGMPDIKEIAEKVVAKQNSDQAVKVEFGKVKFPTKLYGEFLYPAGKYEAILITLGDGTGANWWCVLFPPLCFLDFSNGVAVSQGFEEEEAKVTADNEAKKAAVDNKSINQAAEEQSGKEEAEGKEESEAQTEDGEKENSAEEAVESEEESAEAETAAAGMEEADAQGDESVEEETTQIEKATKEMEEKQDQEESAEKQEPVYMNEKDEVEVKFFFKEVWNKIFG